MKNLLLVFCLTSFLLAATRAAEPAPAIELKNKSTFDASDGRDPFWPIGWKRPGPKISSSGPDLSPGSFSLTSVTMGAGARYAILNGKTMQEGQQFGLQFGKNVYHVTLRAIQDGKVIVAYQGSEITVPLRRK
jgi:hypothetical protein